MLILLSITIVISAVVSVLMRTSCVVAMACSLALVVGCGGGGSSTKDGGVDANHDSPQVDGNPPEDGALQDAAPDSGGSSLPSGLLLISPERHERLS